MIATASDKKWFDEFIVELRLRDVLGHAIGDAVASARELLADTGQSAEEAFGPARTYAASLELPRDSGPGWATRGLWPSLLGVLAFLLFVQVFVAWAQDERFLISPAQLALLVAPAALVAFLPLYLQAAMRRPWLLGLLLIIGAVLGFVSSAVAPASPGEAWLSLDPVPWLLGSTVAMVLLSLWNTVQTLRRGNVDDITTPLPEQLPHRYQARRAFSMLANWFFPLFAAIMLGLFLLLQR